MHECGHGGLLPSRRLDRLVELISGTLRRRPNCFTVPIAVITAITCRPAVRITAWQLSRMREIGRGVWRTAVHFSGQAHANDFNGGIPAGMMSKADGSPRSLQGLSAELRATPAARPLEFQARCCRNSPECRVTEVTREYRYAPSQVIIRRPGDLRSDICSGSSRCLRSSSCFRSCPIRPGTATISPRSRAAVRLGRGDRQPRRATDLASTGSVSGHAKYNPRRSRSVRYCGVHTLKMRQHGGSPLRRGAVTHERQRDSDGLGAVSGEIAATVAQARRREKSTGDLSSRMCFATSRTVMAVIGFTK